MSADTFASLGVPATLSDVLDAQGITIPTPIQAATLPDSLAGRDVLGRGRTGSGKTFAFLLPLVTRLVRSGQPRRARAARALILAPTRELVGQIESSLAPLAKSAGLTSQTIFGGVGQNPQVRGMARGVDVVIACPGRLQDLINQGHVDLGAVEITVLDEADHMADLGFLPVVRRLLDRTPHNGQRLLFSATLDAGVDVIAKRYLTNPVTHHADSAQSPITAMHHHVLHVAAADRVAIITDLAAAPGRTVVFTRTKHGAKKLAKTLNSTGVASVELHGNLSQGARTRNLDAFHSGAATTLVATDIAARGIHVDDVALVVHADPPVEHKAYLHRSGRTARAGAEGTVVTIMTDDQVRDVRALTKAAGIKPVTTRVDARHPLLRELAPGDRLFVEGGTEPVSTPAQQSRPARSSGGRSRGASGGGNRSRGAAAATPGGDGRRTSRPRGGTSGGTRSGAGPRTASSSRPGSTRSGGAAAFSSSTRAGGR